MNYCHYCGYYFRWTSSRCPECGEKIMSLRKEQSRFVRAVADLIQWAYAQGYELTFGDAWARGGHKEGSFHYKRLAIDLNLFKDGRYLTKTEDHEPLGKYWESLGGTWGGRFKNKDGNHYSWGE
ncbi:MAG: M15 family metallopeptidase [Methermicoccaceae archaeon]